MTVDMRLSNQWASRPAHERFLSLEDQLRAAEQQEAELERRMVTLPKVMVLGHQPEKDTRGRPLPGGLLVFRNPGQDVAYAPTRHAFGQFASEIGAPAAYLRKLPADLAAANVRHGLDTASPYLGRRFHALVRHADDGSRAALANDLGGLPVSDLCAVVSEGYGFIPHSKVIRALIRLNERSGGRWQIPAASYANADPKRASTLYMGTGDLFDGLVYEGTVEVNGRPLKIGVIATNSFIKTRTCALEVFSYDTICDNRMIWGYALLGKASIRHTLHADRRFGSDFVRAIDIMAGSVVAGEALSFVKGKLEAGANTPMLVDEKGKGAVRVETPDQAARWLSEHDYGVESAKAAVAVWMAEEGRVPTTVYDAAQVATAGNRTDPDADRRHEKDSLAGKWLAALPSADPAFRIAVA